MCKYHFNFVNSRKIFFTISLCIVALTIICVAVFGVNLDIQFKGGTLIKYSYTNELDKAAFQKAFETAVGGPVSLQESVDSKTGVKNLQVSLSEARGIPTDKIVEISKQLNDQFPDTEISLLEANSVDPTIGGEFLAKCLVAVAFASLLMIIYVAIRFKVIGGWSAGVTAVIALIHDVIVVFATFVIFRIPINDNFIAVVLVILGYSLNDTIVIYDRIRENKRILSNKTTLHDLVNLSLNQSFTRTLATSVTTITAMVCVVVVALIYKVNSIVFFAFPLIMGLISGFYSSLCLSSTLWVTWQDHKADSKAAEKAVQKAPQKGSQKGKK